MKFMRFETILNPHEKLSLIYFSQFLFHFVRTESLPQSSNFSHFSGSSWTLLSHSPRKLSSTFSVRNYFRMDSFSILIMKRVERK